MEGEKSFADKKRAILKKNKIIKEINALSNSLDSTKNAREKNIILSQIKSLKKVLEKTNSEISLYEKNIKNLSEIKRSEGNYLKKEPNFAISPTEKLVPKEEKNLDYTPLEESILKRIKKKKLEIIEKKEKKPSKYVKISSRIFYNFSLKLLNKGMFKGLKNDVVRSNLEFVPATYLSVVFFTTLLSIIISFILLVFFLFFNISLAPPFILGNEKDIFSRFLEIFWILLVIPAMTFIFAFFYPSMERKSLENRINNELPLATMHMSSISDSMIEPSKIFSIIITTNEYPYLEKEFIKLQNEINIYGYDLVTALKNRAHNSPSKKLAELFSGIAITITSGGNLPEFFEKRSQNLLFEYRLDMEKQSKAAETFMDIYISIVIAAPMILMLLLMMMSIGGLGISLNPFSITLTIILSVALINVLFLVFLHLKQPKN